MEFCTNYFRMNILKLVGLNFITPIIPATLNTINHLKRVVTNTLHNILKTTGLLNFKYPFDVNSAIQPDNKHHLLNQVKMKLIKI